MVVIGLVRPCPLAWPTGFPWDLLGTVLPSGSHFSGPHAERSVTSGTISRALSPCAVPGEGGAVSSNPVLNEVWSKLLDEGVCHSCAPRGRGLSIRPLSWAPSWAACRAVRVRGSCLYKRLPWLELSLSFLHMGWRSLHRESQACQGCPLPRFHLALC